MSSKGKLTNRLTNGGPQSHCPEGMVVGPGGVGCYPRIRRETMKRGGKVGGRRNFQQGGHTHSIPTHDHWNMAETDYGRTSGPYYGEIAGELAGYPNQYTISDNGTHQHPRGVSRPTGGRRMQEGGQAPPRGNRTRGRTSSPNRGNLGGRNRFNTSRNRSVVNTNDSDFRRMDCRMMGLYTCPQGGCAESPEDCPRRKRTRERSLSQLAMRRGGRVRRRKGGPVRRRKGGSVRRR